MDEKLSYDDEFLEALLPEDVKSTCQDRGNTLTHIHLIVSLILYLAMPLKPLLHYLFSTINHRVSKAAGIFISRRDEQQISFGPSDLYNLWHTRYPRCRNNLTELVINPSARAIVLAESDSAISDPKLKIKLPDLAVDSVLAPELRAYIREPRTDGEIVLFASVHDTTFPRTTPS